MAGDPLFDEAWRHYLMTIGRQVGLVDFAELIYLRSELYLTDQRRTDKEYRPPVEPLFGEKEGKIAKASLRRDPLFLFAALQRQLNYPEVPRPKARDDASTRVEAMVVKMRELDARVKLLESEARGTLDIANWASLICLRMMNSGSNLAPSVQSLLKSRAQSKRSKCLACWIY